MTTILPNAYRLHYEFSCKKNVGTYDMISAEILVLKERLC